MTKLKLFHGSNTTTTTTTTLTSESSTTSENSHLYEWKWPEGCSPPLDVIDNPEKMAILHALQAKFDEHSHETKFREKAIQSYWDINNKTLVRYLDGTTYCFIVLSLFLLVVYFYYLFVFFNTLGGSIVLLWTAAEWKPLFGNITIYDSIMETIHWRLEFPMPVKDIDLLSRGLSSGCSNIHNYK